MPEGYEVEEGQQGGYYYETGSGDEGDVGLGEGLDLDSSAEDFVRWAQRDNDIQSPNDLDDELLRDEVTDQLGVDIYEDLDEDEQQAVDRVADELRSRIEELWEGGEENDALDTLREANDALDALREYTPEEHAEDIEEAIDQLRDDPQSIVDLADQLLDDDEYSPGNSNSGEEITEESFEVASTGETAEIGNIVRVMRGEDAWVDIRVEEIEPGETLRETTIDGEVVDTHNAAATSSSGERARDVVEILE